VALWTREILQELNRQSRWPLDIQEQSLVTARNGNDAAEAKFFEYLKALYAQRPPDLIIAINTPAARFVQRHRAELFPTTPMLLAVVEVRRIEQSMLSEQDAVVGLRFDQVAVAENILRLLPETKAIAMIIGNSPAERFWVGEQQRILSPLLKNKVELIFYNEQPFEEILKAVASSPPHSAIFFQQMMVDGAGAVYGDKEPLKRIYEVANAPIFSFDEFTLTVRLLVAQCFHRPRVLDRLLLLPSECWEEKREVTSRLLRSNFQHRNMIGDYFSAGTSAKAACHRGAKSCFGSQRHGSIIRGESR
jgi:hypothetical protein